MDPVTVPPSIKINYLAAGATVPTDTPCHPGGPVAGPGRPFPPAGATGLRAISGTARAPGTSCPGRGRPCRLTPSRRAAHTARGPAGGQPSAARGPPPRYAGPG
ncbi:hypothetical protein GCM10027187_22570 [Streptosporangium sandarakinum]